MVLFRLKICFIFLSKILLLDNAYEMCQYFKNGIRFAFCQNDDIHALVINLDLDLSRI